MPDQTSNPGTQFLERKLATILSADVAEFSRLMGEDEEGTLKTFRGHKKIFESLVTLHRGRIFNTAGDAILAEFNSAVEAVRCATDIQSALRTRNDQLPPGRQVRFRIGINLGDVMVQGQDLLGDGVNLAARLQTAAEPGGVCLSGSVYDQIRNKLSLSFQSLGERTYKNIQQPVRTFSITETEGRAALPSPKPSGAWHGPAKWVLGTAGAVILAGGVYYAYTQYAGPSSTLQSAPQQSAAPTPSASPAPAPAETSPPTNNSTSSAAPKEAAPSESAPAAVAAVKPSKPVPKKAPAARAVASIVAFDGVYSGPLCYGKTDDEPTRCFRTAGTVENGKIASTWMMGKEIKTAMVLNGEVSPGGLVHITIEMHRNSPDGERVGSIMLAGTLKDGVIDTAGAFARGRSATLNWQKNESAPR